LSGFAGIFNLDGAPVSRSLLAHMTSCLEYRGPDASGIWSDAGVGMSHTMLRASWESRSERQPATLDGRIWVVADARIDGRHALAAKLGGPDAASLAAAPDSELVLRAYARWGEDCGQHLYGDFAFAIWDSRERKLFCARDHFGLKPFYYAVAGRSFIFTNTLRCLQTHPGVSDRLNELAVADYLLFGYKQDPSATSFHEIRRLPPAHSMRVSESAVSVRRYWSLDAARRIQFRQPAEYLEKFTELFREAVEDRLHCSSTGIFLSGGMDSSSVAAMATLVRTPQECELLAYTAVADRDGRDSERHYSAITAQALRIPVQYLPVDDYMPFDRWDDEAVRGSEPGSTPFSAIACDQLRQIELHSRVALSGDGGDHVLYPSRNYFFDLLRKGRLLRLTTGGVACIRTLRRIPRFGFRSGVKRIFRKDGAMEPMPAWIAAGLARKFDLPSRWRQYAAPPPAEPSALRPEAYERLTNPSLASDFELSDPGATLCRVEVRCPLFDVRLAEYLMAIPPVPWNFDKGIMRLAMRGLLPDTIRLRPKTPLACDPLRSRLEKPECAGIDDFTAHPDLAAYVDRSRIPKLAGGQSRQGTLNEIRHETKT
jgi:asparagine synthase (glutamine-hydrolysing)